MIEQYNGWTNYETWNANLWPMNDYDAYHIVRSGRPYTPETAKAMMLKLYPDGTPDMADRGGVAAYDRVNWREIAEAWNEE